MSAPSSIAVAVLAGGEGSRIGGYKQLVTLGGRTLVERAFDRATGWSATAIVVVRSKDQLGPCRLPSVVDAPGIEGPLAGLAAALDWAGRERVEGLLTIACDMPFLPDDLPARLSRALVDFGAAVASSGAQAHPVCGIWRPAVIDELPAYCASGRRSLIGFAEHVGFVEVEWPVAPDDPFFNINSAADLAAAEAMLGG